MPYYAKINGTDTRVNLYSAAPTYYPTQDTSGAACNMTSGAATGYYANGSQIYMTTADWHTIWTGSQSLGIASSPGVDAYAYTTISGLSKSITSSMPLKMYATTSGASSGDVAKWVTEDNEPQTFEYDKRTSNTRFGIASASVWAPDYASSSSVQITTRFDDQSGRLLVTPSIKVTEIRAYY